MFKPIRPETLMRWAESKLGPSKCRRIIYINRKKEDWLGEWDWEGVITINLHRVKSYSTLYRTVAHEWAHAQQKYRDYKYWHRRRDYKGNPLEKEATFVENNLHKSKSLIIKAKKMVTRRYIQKIENEGFIII